MEATSTTIYQVASPPMRTGLLGTVICGLLLAILPRPVFSLAQMERIGPIVLVDLRELITELLGMERSGSRSVLAVILLPGVLME
jgi:hypothetical protein